MWLMLDPRPGKWNGDAHRAWRYHPAELAKLRDAGVQSKAANHANQGAGVAP